MPSRIVQTRVDTIILMRWTFEKGNPHSTSVDSAPVIADLLHGALCLGGYGFAASCFRLILPILWPHDRLVTGWIAFIPGCV